MESPFRYFERPHEFSNYQAEPARCDLCGEMRAGYKGAFTGLNRIDFVCEVCLVAGRLSANGNRANEGDRQVLEDQIRELRPNLTEDEREALINERTTELEQRTPGVVSWQDWAWPAHCGDYCRYIKEVGQPDIEKLAPDGDGTAYFAAHVRDAFNAAFALDLWQDIRPDAPQDTAVAYGMGVYWFRCLICGEDVFLWDMD